MKVRTSSRSIRELWRTCGGSNRALQYDVALQPMGAHGETLGKLRLLPLWPRQACSVRAALPGALVLKSLPGYCCSRYRFARHWFGSKWFGGKWFGRQFWAGDLGGWFGRDGLGGWFLRPILVAGFGGLLLPMNQFGGLPLPIDQFAGCLTSMPELGGRKAQQRQLVSLSADRIYANSFP